jgi:hypothetical protein
MFFLVVDVDVFCAPNSQAAGCWVVFLVWVWFGFCLVEVTVEQLFLMLLVAGREPLSRLIYPCRL